MPLTNRQQAIQELLAVIDRINSRLATAKIHLAELESRQDEQETRS